MIAINQGQTRSYISLPLHSWEDKLLIVGQFALFMGSVLLIIYHFKERLGVCKYSALSIVTLIVFLLLSLFICLF